MSLKTKGIPITQTYVKLRRDLAFLLKTKDLGGARGRGAGEYEAKRKPWDSDRGGGGPGAAKMSKRPIHSALFIYLVHLSAGHFPSECPNRRECLSRARSAFQGYEATHEGEVAS